jgi:hypothetical protein
MSRRPIASLLALSLLLVGGTACKEKHPTAPKAELVTLVGQGKVQVMIQQDTRVKGDSAVFVVSIVGNGVPVASYQGTLTFDVGSMDIKAVETPTAVAGEFRIVNGTDMAKGSLRFAGFATERFSTVEAFRIVGNFKPGNVPTNLLGRLDVAGETTGSAIRASNLMASNAVLDAYSGMAIAR